MTKLTLMWRTLARHKTRTIFTILSVTTAFTIFTVLMAIQHGMSGHISMTSASRLITYNGLGGGKPLPVNYVDKIASVPGVAAVSYLTLSQGYFRDPQNLVTISAFSPNVFEIYPEFKISPEAKAEFVQDRQSAIIGPELAKRMNWKVGETVPLQGGPVQQDGSTTWYFHIVGIYEADLPLGYQGFFTVNYAYLNEGVANNRNRDVVLQFREVISDPKNVGRVASDIDAVFQDMPVQTKTRSEDELTASTLRQFGDIGSIVTYTGAAVFFSMLLITGNAMANSVRERFGEFATMRALGFGRFWPVSIVLMEASTIIGVGAVVGLGAGWFVGRILEPIMTETLQSFAVTWHAFVLGAGSAILFSLMVSAVPGQRLFRLCIASTLRKM